MHCITSVASLSLSPDYHHSVIYLHLLIVIILILLSYSISSDPGLIYTQEEKRSKGLNNYYKNKKKIINKLNLGKLNSNKITTY